MKNDFCFLLIIKNEHKYFFKYMPGTEKALFFTLIEYGKDDRYNLTLIEVLHLIRKMSAHLRENGNIRNFTFHVTPEESE